MARPPAHRRSKDPYARQVLGVRVTPPLVIAGHALHVLREVAAGHYRHMPRAGWCLHTPHSTKNTPVDLTVKRLIEGGYLTAADDELAVTAKGQSELESSQ
jgi:hypothetical protein